MKANVFRVDWLIPVLGLALVGGGYALTKSYLGFKEEIRSEEQLVVIADHLLEDCRLSRILMQAQDSGCAATARSLDELLAANIVAVNSELTSAGTRGRALAEACFQHIARQRSQNSPAAADWPAGRSDRQLVAPVVFGQELASAYPGN
jgi:hypothetical protein